MKRTLPLLLLAVAVVAACKDGTGSTPLTDLQVQPDNYFLGVGDTVHLTATGTDENHQSVTVTSASYKSTNPSVASVSGDGKVTGVAVGTAQIVAKSGGQSDTATVNVLPAGSIKTFNVDAVSTSGCTEPIYHGARQVASTAHVLIYEDVNNPSGGFTNAEYQSIADEFEAKIYPTDVANFGQPTDLDQNGKVIILYTRAVNELTPPGANFIYGGFFYSRDLFPRTATARLQACPSSNYSEMFYVLSADPNGTINGHVRDKEYVRESTLSTTAHEFQHLINASRRLYVNNANDFEDVWLDEGLAHVAEELVYYAESGHTPRQNIGQAQILANQQQLDDFNEFQIQNTGRWGEYLKAPNTNSWYASNDELETRGATWNFLRYSADRRNGNDQAFWFSLVNSTTSGLNNLAAALATDPITYARDWSVSVYTDDAAPVAAQFTEPSWNYRDIYKNSGLGGTYPLKVNTLASGTPLTLTVKSGSAGYVKFAVPAASSADVRVAQSGTTVGGACTPLVMNVGDVQQVVMNAGVAVCPAGGVAGAEYVVIPFYGSSTIDATINLGITGTGVAAPVGPPTPNRIAASASATPFALDGYTLNRPYDGGLEHEMRVRERRILANLLVSANGPRRAVSGVDGPGGVTVNIVRTK